MRLLTAALAAPLLLAGSCAPDRMSLEVRQLCYPTDTCTFSSTCEKQYIGAYAVTAGADLSVFMEVANQSTNNADTTLGRVNSNDAHVTGVHIDLAGGLSAAGSISLLNNEFVPAGGSAVIGAFIPTAAAPAGSVVNAQVRLTGYYDNGRHFETGDVPLDIGVYAAAGLGHCSGSDVVKCPPNGTNTLLQEPSACAAP